MTLCDDGHAEVCYDEKMKGGCPACDNITELNDEIKELKQEITDLESEANHE